MATQESTTQSVLKTQNRSSKIQANSLKAPIFNYERAEDEGEMYAKSPQSRALVARILERVKNRQR